MSEQNVNVSSSNIASINARIDRLPVWGLSRAVLLIVGFSYFFAFYDITAFGFSLPTLISAGIVSESASAIPGSAYLFGYIAGALIIGNISDKIGRKNGLTYTVMILTVGGILTALSWNLASFSIFRFITGMGTGAELSIAATIISELSPNSTRGRFLQYNYFWGAIGLGVAQFIIVPMLSTTLSWRLVFGFGAVVGIFILVIRTKMLPESPRWLVIEGRDKEAESLVESMEKLAEKKTGKQLPAVPQTSEEFKPKEKVPIVELFKQPYLYRSLMIISFWSVWYITVYAWLGYEPLLLGKLGVSFPGGLLFVALSDLAIPVAAVVAFIVVDMAHRKYLVALVGFIFAISSLVVAFSTNSTILFIGSFFGAFCIGANSVAYAYTAEMFPSRIRATATSFGDGGGHIGGALAPFIAIGALSLYGAQSTFVLLAIIVFLSGVIALFGPKTTKVPLTELAK